jgi:hypothetical protein
MSTIKFRYFLYGTILFLSTSIIASAGSEDGVFGDYFTRMIWLCPASSVVTGFDTNSNTYGARQCKTISEMIGSIFGSSPTAQNGQAMVGFNTDGTLKYGDVGAFFRTGNNISYTGGNVGIGITNPDHKLVVNGTDAVAHFLSNGWNAYLRLSIYNDITRRIELANRDGRTALWNPQTGDAFNVVHTNGYVGVWTATPGYKLHVMGDIYANGGWLRTSGNAGWYNESYGWGWYMQDPSWIRSYGSKPVYMDAWFDTWGPAGIGCWGWLGGGYVLRVCGSALITGNITSNGSFIYSDSRLKSNITALTGSLNKILSLNGYSYILNSNKNKSIGVIAQEVEQVFPDLVHENDTWIKSVEYSNLVAPLIEAIKEQQTMIENQQNQINHLYSQIQKTKK